jgi:pimeloyl-ACP methyl ester carboxylesterase
LPSWPHNGESPPSCSQPLRLDVCLERFRREASWRSFDTGRYSCRYVLWGRGPALIFIPGLCDDPWSFVLPMARLSEQFLCIAYTMPTGHGDGARLRSYRHAELAADLHGLCDHLGLKQAYLLGVSFGSTVALRALHDWPQRFPRGILQGGFARRPLALAEVMLASWARWWPGEMRKLPLRTAILEQMQRPTFAGREPAVWDYFMHHDGSQPMAAIAQKAVLLHHLDVRPLLPAIRQPVLLVCGEHDPLVSKAREQELLAGLPNVARAEIECCGHLPQYTHPETLSEIIERYLTGKREACG